MRLGDLGAPLVVLVILVVGPTEQRALMKKPKHQGHEGGAKDTKV